MHLDILSKNQTDLLPYLTNFSKNYYLAGGTAIALYLGHRKSIDFDLFTDKKVESNKVLSVFRKDFGISRILVDEPQEITFVTNNVKLTFLNYPFNVQKKEWISNYVQVPSLLSLAALKAYALGRRSKWKDYVDLYFLLKQYSINQIVKEATNIFKNEFDEKLFRAQLVYFEDIDYSEKVDFIKGFEVADKNIKDSLMQIAVSIS